MQIILADNIRTAWMVSMQLSDISTMYMTTAPFQIQYNNNTYLPSSLLQSIGRIADVAKANDTQLSLAFTGVDIQFKEALLAANDKGLGGRPTNIYRVFFNESWEVDRILPRYFGVINSVAIDDNWETTPGGSQKPVTFNVGVNLKTQQQVLKQRIAGRFTSQASMQNSFPSDTSFNGIAGLRDRTITLGKDL